MGRAFANSGLAGRTRPPGPAPWPRAQGSPAKTPQHRALFVAALRLHQSLSRPRPADPGPLRDEGARVERPEPRIQEAAQRIPGCAARQAEKALRPLRRAAAL